MTPQNRPRRRCDSEAFGKQRTATSIQNKTIFFHHYQYQLHWSSQSKGSTLNLNLTAKKSWGFPPNVRDACSQTVWF